MLVEFLQWHQRQEQEAEINSTQPRTPVGDMLSRISILPDVGVGPPLFRDH